jgi:hypothetical protein
MARVCLMIGAAAMMATQMTGRMSCEAAEAANSQSAAISPSIR